MRAAQRALDAIAPKLQDVADEMDVTYDALYSWRKGRTSPSLKNLRRLAEIADRQADQLRGVASELRSIADTTEK